MFAGQVAVGGTMSVGRWSAPQKTCIESSTFPLIIKRVQKSKVWV